MNTNLPPINNLTHPVTLGLPHNRKSVKRAHSLLALAALGALALANPAQAQILWQAGANSGNSTTWTTGNQNWNTATATPWATAGNFAALGDASVTLGAAVRMNGFSGSGSIGAASAQQLRIGGAGVTSSFSGTIGNNVFLIWDAASILDFSGINNNTSAASQWLFRNGGTFRLSSATALQTMNTAKVESGSGTFTFELASADLRINNSNLYLNNSGTGNTRFAAIGADRTVIYTGGNTSVSAPATTFIWNGVGGTGTSIGDTMGLGNANSTGKLTWASDINLNGGTGSLLTRKIDVINGSAATGGEISGAISDSGTTKATLEKTGNGTLVLSGNNTYTGLTTVTAGTLQLAKTASLYNGTDSNWTKAKISASTGSTVAFNVGGTGEFSTGNVTTLLNNLTGDVTTGGFKGGSSIGFNTANASGGNFSVADTIANTTGTGGGTLGVTKLGANTLTLSGNNTYSGGTTVAAGTLVVGSSTALGSTTGALTVNNGSTLDLGSFSATVGAVTLNSGSFTGSGTLTGSSYTVSSGTIAPTLAGIGTLTKTGSGTVTLTGNNTYTGATAVSLGTLEFAPASGSSTLTGNVTGAGAIIKSGAGTLILASAVNGGSSFSGSLAVNGGTLQIGNKAVSNDQTGRLASVSSVTVGSGGTLTLASSSALNSGAAITLNGTINVNTLGLPSNQGFHNTFGALNMNGGTLTTGNGANTGTFQSIVLNGNVTVSGTSASSITAGGSEGNAIHLLSNAAGNRTFNVADVTSSSAADLTVSARLVNASNGSQAAGLIKSGAGTMVLSGNNTYTGATTVSTGTLLISGTGSINSTSDILVSSGATFQYNSTTALTKSLNLGSGATLGGSGVVGNVNLASGSFLKPGNSPGLLTASTATWAAGSTYNWEIDNATGTAGTNWDVFAVTGALTLSDLSSSAKMNLVLESLSIANYSTSAPFSWTIARAGSLIGDGLTDGADVTALFNINATAFNGGNLPTNGFKVEVGTSGSLRTLNLMAIPEPSTGSLMIFGLGGLVLTRLLRRKVS
jgi:autotransporter-associated beta strand protein